MTAAQPFAARRSTMTWSPMAGVWPVILTAIFLPLAVRRFHKLSR
ncbi:hypothetical protein [Streptomyces sp. NPDC098781]